MGNKSTSNQQAVQSKTIDKHCNTSDSVEVEGCEPKSINTDLIKEFIKHEVNIGYITGSFKVANNYPILTGKCKLEMKDGSIYEGDIMNGNINGIGILTFIDGTKYEGEFKNGKYHGKGKYISSSGNCNDGNYIDGKFQSGKYKGSLSDGSIYEGESKDNKMHGYGKIIHPDGTIYEGYFRNDMKHGYGMKKFTNDGLFGEKIIGTWVNNELHGIALVTKNGVEYKYKIDNGIVLEINRM